MQWSRLWKYIWGAGPMGISHRIILPVEQKKSMLQRIKTLPSWEEKVMSYHHQTCFCHLLICWNGILLWEKAAPRGEMWGALLCFSKTTKQKINGWEWCFVLLAINLGSRWLMGVWFPGDNQPKTPDPNTPAKTSLHSNSTITLLIIPNITETKHHSLASSNSQIPTPFYIYRENPGSKSGGNTHGGEGGGEERWGVHGIRCCGFF